MTPGALVVAFAGTTDAFSFEDAAAAAGWPGRLVPLPESIDASCGLGWLVPPGAELPEAAREMAYEGVFRRDPHGFARVDAP